MRLRGLARGLGLVVIGPLSASAQDPSWNAGSVHADRVSLQRLERRFEAAAESPAYSTVLRSEARREAAKLRTRLQSGDFQVGDRVFLTVERDTALTDTFTVAQGQVLDLPGLGQVSLSGVLRSEVQGHLDRFVRRFVREPVVRARSFVRISVAGEVENPGFYLVPTDLVLTDALSLAGGGTNNAEMTKLSIRRSDAVLWEAAMLQEAIAEGRTVDQLDVRTGDQIVVGRRGGGGLGGIEGPVRTLSIIFAIPLTIAGVVTLF